MGWLHTRLAYNSANTNHYHSADESAFTIIVVLCWFRHDGLLGIG